MLKGGNVTIYVSDMNRAVRFYSEALGLTVKERYGDHWAAIDAGGGLVIGLHPATLEQKAGIPGSISIGFEVTASIEEAVERLTRQGVTFHGVIARDKAGSFAFFADPDGNPCYLYQLQAQPSR